MDVLAWINCFSFDKNFVILMLYIEALSVIFQLTNVSSASNNIVSIEYRLSKTCNYSSMDVGDVFSDFKTTSNLRCAGICLLSSSCLSYDICQISGNLSCRLRYKQLHTVCSSPTLVSASCNNYRMEIMSTSTASLDESTVITLQESTGTTSSESAVTTLEESAVITSEESTTTTSVESLVTTPDKSIVTTSEELAVSTSEESSGTSSEEPTVTTSVTTSEDLTVTTSGTTSEESTVTTSGTTSEEPTVTTSRTTSEVLFITTPQVGSCQNSGTYDPVHGNCTCVYGCEGEFCETCIIDCMDGKDNGYTGSSVLAYIKPIGVTSPFETVCNFNAGVTYIQSRSAGDVDFNRNWEDYNNGFGNINGDFWLGLKQIKAIIDQRQTEIWFVLHDGTKNNYFAYSNTTISDETSGYKIRGYDTFSNDPDAFAPQNKPTVTAYDQPFQTYDRDTNSCAASSQSGWWFNTGCSISNMNAPLPVMWDTVGPILTTQIALKP